MAKEKEFITAPIIDMEAVQKVANEAATKAVIKSIEEYYTGHNSPFRKQIDAWLKENAPSVQLELPAFGELVNQSLKAEIDEILKVSAISNYASAIRRGLTHQNLQEDGTLKLSDLCKEMEDVLGYGRRDDDDYIEVEVKETHNSWLDMSILVNKDGEEVKYEVTLHMMFDKSGNYCILSLPYKMEDGLYCTKTRVKTDNGISIEMPAYVGVTDDDVLMAIARCVMFHTPIVIDTHYYITEGHDY